MPPRAPGVHTHEEWKGMAQPVGLVVEPVVLNRLGIFPESATTVLADWQQRLEQLLEDQPVGEQWLSVAPSFELFCQEVLAWQPGDLRKPEELPAPPAVQLDDYDEVLRPDWIIPEPSKGDGPLKAQVLVQELPWIVAMGPQRLRSGSTPSMTSATASFSTPEAVDQRAPSADWWAWLIALMN
jgi:hypothetical protein